MKLGSLTCDELCVMFGEDLTPKARVSETVK